MYIFRTHINNIDDIKGEDPMLCLGHFSLTGHEVNINFFSSRYCMCFLTLHDLMNSIITRYSNLNYKYDWVGCDNGAIINLIRVKNKITFKTKEFEIIMDFNTFIKAIQVEVKNLENLILSLNPKIENDSFFKDFKKSVDFFSKF